MLFIVATLTAFLFTFVLLPIIINITRSVKLLDQPDRRKVHIIGTPSMGGIAIFVGFMIAILIAAPADVLISNRYFFSAVGLIFFLGIRDDVSSLYAQHKLVVQIFAAALVVGFSDFHLTGLYGLMGIHELPLGLEYLLSIGAIVILTNSFNLIDGIDGLAASLATVILLFFSWVFFLTDAPVLAIVSLSCIGALFAFLIYNWYPSRIFMGDTGSMVLGFLISTLSLKVINLSDGLAINSFFSINSSVALVIACLIVPFYDTLRVFTIRFVNKKSPFAPDRNHIHHSFLKLGFNHAQATSTLVAFNLLSIGLILSLNNILSNGWLLLILFSITFAFGATVDHLVSKRKMLGISSKLETKKVSLTVSKSA
ncbi:MAG: glycosyltransferase family 4 protein [Bacteroidota bacterium]